MADKNNRYRTFSALGAKVSAENGELRNVSLITLGEALNHGELVDNGTLISVLDCLGDTPLKAYDSHCGGDSVEGILGFFSGFKLAGNKIIAEKFSFRPSADEKSKTAILECAQIAPEAMGVSFTALTGLVWVLEDGTELDFFDSVKRPEKAVNELPAIRFTKIFSADFVGSPAANPNGLYDAQNAVKTQPKVKNMANEILAYFAAKYAAQPAKLAKAALKLSADEGATKEEIEKQVEGETEVEELKNKLASLEAENKELKDKLATLECEKSEGEKKLAEAEKQLSALKGQAPFPVGTQDGGDGQKKLEEFEAQYSALIAAGDTAGAAKLYREYTAKK